MADENDDRWSFQIGAGAEIEPAYTGSDEYATEALFDLRATYQLSPNKELQLSLGEIGLEWELENDWTLLTVLEYEEGRDNSEDPILAEFDEVENTLEGQITLVKSWDDFFVFGALQPDILGRGKGLVSFVGLGYEYNPTSKLSLETTLDISFADSEHMMTEVGVTDAVSQRSGIDAYQPSSGYKSTTLSLEADYAFNNNWSLFSSASYEFYGNNMADSPLIKTHGTKQNYAMMAGIVYRF